MGLTGGLVICGVILVLAVAAALTLWLLSRPRPAQLSRSALVTQRLAEAQAREDASQPARHALRPVRDPAPDVSYPGGSAYGAGAWHHSTHYGPGASGAEAGGSIGHDSGSSD